MALFQNSVLNKYLKTQDKTATAKAYKKFIKYFHNPTIQQNIRESKEEQFQEGFLRELFVTILGYTLNPKPNYNLTTELKNEKGAKKADGAILTDNKALAVIELKGTKTKDLESIRQQAFDYKSNQTNCIYVITSNFEKLRFYINNAVEFEEFNLFTLTAFQFELFYLCLHQENLLNNIPLKIKEASIVEEEKITKKFYADYSLFKRELFRDLVKKNLKNEVFRAELNKEDLEQANKNIKLSLFKKSQKLIDRFLFIFFAEDRGLLTPNSTLKILKQWDKLKELDEIVPLYNRYKKYFHYLDTGRKGTDKRVEIFAYNGGLFKPDAILDSLLISDDLIYKHTKTLANYNFESQVDVNILGHIFENSLNEIESVNAEIEGTQFDKQKTKRKKDGVFYTPKYITKYIVDNTVGKLCTEKKEEFGISNIDTEKKYLLKDRRTVEQGIQVQTGQGVVNTIKKIKTNLSVEGYKLIEKIEAYRLWLLQITICDPACGSGAFLNQALDFLIKEHSDLDELMTIVQGKSMVFPNIENTVLENNIFGVDLNEESVEIAKLSLWLRTAQPRRKLNDLNSNIKCGNSLIDSKSVAGEKAFKWEEEFPRIFEKGGFDVVIGNPPYVFARNKISNELKDYYTKNYISAEYQVNTYLLFIEQTIKLIRDAANYGLIVPNAWLMVGSAKSLRNFILQNCKINEIINLSGYSFEGVNVETIIILATKTKLKDDNNTVRVLMSNDKEFIYSHSRKQTDFENNTGFEFKVFSDETSVAITKKLKVSSKNLDDLVFIKAGLQAYEKNKGEPKQTVEDVKNRPYDYTYKFDKDTYKYLEGKDVGRYFLKWSGQYLKYGKHLAAPRTFNLFDGEKIIIREITGKYPHSIISTFSDKLYLYNRSNIAIVEKPELHVSLKYVVAVLNSQLMSYYFVKNTAKSVRKMFPKIILNDLRKFPFKEIPKGEQQPFIDKTDSILDLNERMQNISSKFTSYLQSQFSIEKLSKKLQNWYELEFGEFITELNKAIKKVGEKKLSKMDEMEWMEVFETKKTETQTLKAEIDKIDKEIDALVYELYELSMEEISIVENS